MPFSRRDLRAATQAATVAQMSTANNAAGAATTDLAVNRDTAAAGTTCQARFGGRISTVPIVPGLILSRIEREIQNDIVVTRFASVDQAEAIYVTNQQPKGFWTDRGYNWFSGV